MKRVVIEFFDDAAAYRFKDTDALYVGWGDTRPEEGESWAGVLEVVEIGNISIEEVLADGSDRD